MTFAAFAYYFVPHADDVIAYRNVFRSRFPGPTYWYSSVWRCSEQYRQLSRCSTVLWLVGGNSSLMYACCKVFEGQLKDYDHDVMHVANSVQ